jgi:hypothetical protein
MGFPEGNPPKVLEARRAIAQILPAERCRYGTTDFSLSTA